MGLSIFNILTWKCASPHNGVHFFDMSTSKIAVRHWFVLYILTWKRASRHNGAHFFTISTSKNGLRPSVFYTFGFVTSKCASRHNGVHFFDIWTSKSGPNVVFCTFWLRNVLRATTACTFSSLIWPDGSAPALASLLFDPPGPQIIGKTQSFATFLLFPASASSFLWLFLFSDLLSSSLLFSDSSHLCFSICPYFRKFDF